MTISNNHIMKKKYLKFCTLTEVLELNLHPYNRIHNRTFTCTEDDIKWGDKVLEEVEQIATIIGLPFNGQYMERFIASWSRNRKKDDIPFDKFVVAANKIKPREYSFNVDDFDRYYRELMGYMF